MPSFARRTSTLADTVEAVVSWRSEGRLAENDQVVPEAGFALYVKTDYANEAANRTLHSPAQTMKKTTTAVRSPAFAQDVTVPRQVDESQQAHGAQPRDEGS